MITSLVIVYFIVKYGWIFLVLMIVGSIIYGWIKG